MKYRPSNDARRKTIIGILCAFIVVFSILSASMAVLAAAWYSSFDYGHFPRYEAYTNLAWAYSFVAVIWAMAAGAVAGAIRSDEF